MAVTDAAWWGVWWPSLLLWAATAGALVVAVSIVVAQIRRYRGFRRLDVAFYLDETAIMDVYQQMRRVPALRRAVSHEIKRSRKFGVRSTVPGVPVGGDAGGQVDETVVRQYVEQDEPITVVGLIVDVLEKTSSVGRIDLERLTFTPSHPDAPVPSAVKVHRGRVRLRDLKSWVLVDGRFERDGARPAFHVRADDEESAAARVRVDCGPASGLRGGIPDGPFLARCLGRVQGWDRAGQELVIDAFAIFR
ncbi:hypothetical protein Dvina_48850 [Dactylosporangium vinaceum]|uniref:Lipid/polyisoprenoid-binding YceI-like domain-containing protein n=1 Tax=Dactylosporangium vinaceum TaxID=53362 RepID=A0ABV5LY74_9ACTN|nr:hypothetical protein [Dactylosporangium vinaceum]UAB95810.1 hypothetical protein Dvina_48850 [Dactylosporangium vinaceum]